MSNYKLESPIDVRSPSAASQINLYNSANTFAVQLQAPASLSSNIDFTLPASLGSVGQYFKRTGAAATSWATQSGFPNYTFPIASRTYSGRSTVRSSASTTLQLVDMFTAVYANYGGSSVTAYAVASATDTTTTIKIQIIYGSTSLITYTSSTFATANTPTMINIGSLGVLPSVASTLQYFTINFAVGSGAGTVSLYEISILG